MACWCRLVEGGFTRYRCHTGHAYTGDTLLVSVTEHIEETLWATMRILEEGVMLLQNTGAAFAEAGNARLAEAYWHKAEALEERSRMYFSGVTDSATLSRDRVAADSTQDG